MVSQRQPVFDTAKVILQNMMNPVKYSEFSERLYHAVSLQFHIEKFEEATRYFQIEVDKQDMTAAEVCQFITDMATSVAMVVFGTGTITSINHDLSPEEISRGMKGCFSALNMSVPDGDTYIVQLHFTM